MNIESKLDCYEDIIDQIRPILSREHPEVQGAVIADLFAIFLAGHQGEQAEKLRKALVDQWLEMGARAGGALRCRGPKFPKKIAKKLRQNREKNEAKLWTGNLSR